LKKFIQQLLIFLAISILPFVVLAITLDKILDEYPLDNFMESKISLLQLEDNTLNIVVGGDSRGERQLIPDVIKSNTGHNTINVCVDAGEVVTLSYALDTYDNYNNVYILSASSWQINDGANAAGYVSQKCFQKLTPQEKLTIYQNKLFELFRMESTLIRLELRYLLNDNSEK
jgi:hypothetical protein